MIYKKKLLDSVCERTRRNIQIAIIKNYLEKLRKVDDEEKKEEYRSDYSHMFTICWRNTSDEDVMRKKREGIKETVEIFSVCKLRFSISFAIFLFFCVLLVLVTKKNSPFRLLAFSSKMSLC